METLAPELLKTMEIARRWQEKFGWPKSTAAELVKQARNDESLGEPDQTDPDRWELERIIRFEIEYMPGLLLRRRLGRTQPTEHEPT